MSIDGDQTPLMKQYGELKAQAGDCLLFFRMGDFYELFGDDAVEAARILEITLTSRDKNKPNPMPMAGVPWHSAQGYIQRLLKAGKKVAIGEQMEAPGVSKIVRREIVRTFTPGVHFDVEGAEANYIASIVAVEPKAHSDDKFILACLDASTGETLVSDPLDAQALEMEFSAHPIRHILKNTAITVRGIGPQILVEEIAANYLSLSQAREVLKRHFGIQELGTFLSSDPAVLALGMLVQYALKTQQQETLSHLKIPSPLRKPRSMVLGPRTAQHLDLIPTQDGTPNLFTFINRTRSALGARQLKRWLLSPLKDSAEILERQQAVMEIPENISREVAEVYDLERIMGRVQARLANPRDTRALGASLAALPKIGESLSRAKSASLCGHREQISRLTRELAALSEEIVRTQREDAPLVSRDGGIFNRGTTPELDRLLTLTEDGERWLIELEAREREATGISSLKVRYNRVFGYYIEITQAHIKSAPAHYQRKQTTMGAERFFTEELKKFEDEIVTANARKQALEQELFQALLVRISARTSVIMEAAQILGELDALVSLASLRSEPGWTFPKIDDGLDIEILQGRHPLVDAASRGAFVPNDLALSDSSRLTLIITGPNMGGKSTIMRQVALILILGQMGAPVPASQARWGSVSSLYTRIGAHDAIARGQSTFMVEMSELAHILHYADERSVIVLDEIGRGTSTYDGISVAWATLEWICSQLRARTLFATHYHELTRLSASLPLVANVHMAVERAGDLRFLYKLKEGAANESFGIHVARIAGLPKAVIDRAWTVLEELERHAPAREKVPSAQLSLFTT